MSRFRLFGRAAGAGTWPDAPTDVPTDPRGFPAVPAGVWGGPPAWAGVEPAPPAGGGNGWSGGWPVAQVGGEPPPVWPASNGEARPRSVGWAGEGGPPGGSGSLAAVSAGGIATAGPPVRGDRPVSGTSFDPAGAPGGARFGGSPAGPAEPTHPAGPPALTAPPATVPPPPVTMPPGSPAHTDGAPHVGAVTGAPGHTGPAWPVLPASAASRVPVPDPAEAAALAGAFAVDYLSWDEDDPARRGRVLRDYLRPPVGDPARLGWSGTGRQRGEFALPGLVRPDGEGRVLVDVRVRVTPYRAVGERTPEPVPADPEPGAGVPAVAPAPTGRGWRSLASCWVRLSVPVAHDGGRLVVDAWEETLGLDAPASEGAPAAAPDHALVDDDPLAGGAA
ncbi:hypothetical protein [Pseudonocardia sp.]|uniref:hypothetical protein n=1 Tax=Pseudonocardia sp. TaxID=60912 RepID=UPI003D0B32DE